MQARLGLLPRLLKQGGSLSSRQPAIAWLWGLARDLVTQELGVVALVSRGVRVLASNGDDLTNTEDPFRLAMRQIAGAFAQLEKARLVAKLKGARDRKLAEGRKVEGRKSLAEIDEEAVALAKKLHRYAVNGRRRSLRQIAAELAGAGKRTRKGTLYGAAAVARMLKS